jgi:hypothetical protein
MEELHKLYIRKPAILFLIGEPHVSGAEGLNSDKALKSGVPHLRRLKAFKQNLGGKHISGTWLLFPQ